jgi:hypothetical protein
MNSNQMTRHVILYFFSVQNGVLLDIKLGILAKVQVGPPTLNFFQFHLKLTLNL